MTAKRKADGIWLAGIGTIFVMVGGLGSVGGYASGFRSNVFPYVPLFPWPFIFTVGLVLLVLGDILIARSGEKAFAEGWSVSAAHRMAAGIALGIAGCVTFLAGLALWAPTCYLWYGCSYPDPFPGVLFMTTGSAVVVGVILLLSSAWMGPRLSPA